MYYLVLGLVAVFVWGVLSELVFVGLVAALAWLADTKESEDA